MKVVFTFPGLMDQQNIEVEMADVPRAGDYVTFKAGHLSLREVKNTTFYPLGNVDDDDDDPTPFAYVVMR